jgi:hypothetical protein
LRVDACIPLDHNGPLRPHGLHAAVRLESVRAGFCLTTR